MHPNAVCGTLDAIEAKFRYSDHLFLHGAGSRDGARGKLAFKALYLLVVGTARARSRTDRLRPTLTRMEEDSFIGRKTWRGRSARKSHQAKIICTYKMMWCLLLYLREN